MPRPITNGLTVYCLLKRRSTCVRDEAWTLILQCPWCCKEQNHQMEPSACDIIVRPPTPIRSDSEISNSPSIDQRQVVKIFVKFVSSQTLRYRLHGHPTTGTACRLLCVGTPSLASLMHNSRNKCLALKVNFYKLTHLSLIHFTSGGQKILQRIYLEMIYRVVNIT